MVSLVGGMSPPGGRATRRLGRGGYPMVGLFPGIVTGCETWEDKQTHKQRSKTFVNLGGRDTVEVDGNGLAQDTPVFLAGNVKRRLDGGLYAVDAQLLPRPAGLGVPQLVEQLQRAMVAPSPASGKAAS